jgi:CheY-like chemotaxis protein
MSPKPKLLVIDDDRTQLELLSERLTTRGYAVTTEEDPGTALRAAERKEYDVVVSDLHMPRLSGLDIARSLQGKVPVVLISGETTRETEKQAAAHGATAVLPKPLSWTDLYDAVEEANRGAPGAMRALVADDHAPTRMLLEKVLDDEGFRVDLASDGEVALEKVLRSQEPYDLLITDILMPRLRGPEVIRRIREIHPTTRIVFMTGAASREEIQKCYRGGAITLWRKPFRMKDVVEELRRIKRTPARPQEDDPGGFLHWFHSLRDQISRDKRKKMALRGTLAILAAMGLTVALIGSMDYLRGIFGSTVDRIDGFMERMEGYMERDEMRDIERDNARR